LVISSRGDLLAIPSHRSLSVYTFDRCKGEVGEEIYYNDTLSGLYGCAFSPNGSYLYVTINPTLGDENILYQISLEKDQFGNNPITEIYHRPENGVYDYGQLELGPDGKIYMSTAYQSYPNDRFSPLNMNLSIIIKPDVFGFACDFDTLSVYLNVPFTASPIWSTTPSVL